MTCSEDAHVSGAWSSRSYCRTSTNSRHVVRNVYTEAVQVVNNKTVLKSRTTKVRVEQTRVLILQSLCKDRVNAQPTSLRINKLLIQQTSHTSDDLQWRCRSSHNRLCTRQ